MLFITPQPIDINNTATQIKQEYPCNKSITNTCLNKAYYISPKDFGLPVWRKRNVFSSDLSLDNMDEQNNATWEEVVLSDFDLVTNAYFNKTIKVKSRIKYVTKYKPNIIID